MAGLPSQRCPHTGLGKTGTTIKTYQILKANNEVKAMLVVAPLRPCFLVWPKEIDKWSNFNDLTIGVLHNDTGTKKEVTLASKKDIYVINPEGLDWLVKQLANIKKKDWPFDMLVIDESTKFKNPSTKRFKLLKKLIPGFSRRYILTGTPTPNGLLGIQSQMYIVDKGKSFGTVVGAFKEEYFTQIGKPQWDNWVPRKGSIDRIYKKCAKYALRMSAADHLDLPERIDNIIDVALPSKARKVYEGLEKELFALLDNGSEINALSPAALRIKCHQVANGSLYEDLDPLAPTVKQKDRKVHILHEAKLDVLEDLVEELDNKPILIGYSYKHDLTQLQKRFGKKLKSMNGSMKDAMKIEKDWNAGKIEMLALYPGTSALGLNLQESGNDIFWYSMPNDFEAYDQFIKRIWRSGIQGSCVRVHHPLSVNTVDEVIYRMLLSKGKSQNDFLDAVEKYRDMKNFAGK